MQICVIKAAMFKNITGIQVMLCITSTSYICFTYAYPATTKKHKDDPSVEISVKGRLPVQWINVKPRIPPNNCAIPRINVDI